jgi:cytochrome c oxidase subunit 2
MLFTVKVVSESEYNAHIDSLAAKGQVGALGPEYNTNTNLPGNEAPTGNK